tara:strand:- start:349 stop:567 length:219 start_codon:yes stop_codon:yes gene_type:complete
MNEAAGSRTIQALGDQAISLFRFFDIASGYRITNLADVCAHIGTDSAVPGSMLFVLFQSLLGTFCVRHNLKQ